MKAATDAKVILQARGIVKDFPGQRALDDVDFDVRSGEVHALIGENGAGKSTLLKIIAGVYHADRGEILVDGYHCDITNPRESQALGLAFIHQELNIVPHLSVAENIFLGRYPRARFGLVSLAKMVESAQNVPNALNVGVDLRTLAQNLSVIQQWKMVINRALAQNSRIIFMDEPTSSLTHEEVNDLFRSITHLKERGTAVVYVSHRMEEIFHIADRVTVIKDAKKTGSANIGEMDSGKIYHMMLGRELKDVFPDREEPQKAVCLEVKNLSRGHVVKNVSFCLHRGGNSGNRRLGRIGPHRIGPSAFRGRPERLRGYSCQWRDGEYSIPWGRYSPPNRPGPGGATPGWAHSSHERQAKHYSRQSG